MNFTNQQTSFFDCLLNSVSHIMLVARAGCGKTTALCEGAKKFQQANPRSSLLAVCFNKSIQEELSSRMPATADTSTMHSLGFKMLKASQSRRWKVDKNKFHDYLKDMFPEWEQRNQICTIIDKMRINLCESVEDAEHFLEEIGAPANLAQTVVEATNWGLTKIVEEGVIDFTDMLWGPIVLKLPATRKYDMVMVDEAQDLSKLQQLLVKKHVNSMGRIVICGDPKQAIYGFAGAQSNSMKQLAKRFTAKPTETRTITQTFRCPHEIVDKAKAEGQSQQTRNQLPLEVRDDDTLWLDDFEALPSAPRGVVQKLEPYELIASDLTHEDAVLCRTNKPLMEMAIWLISQGLGFRINGRDFFKSVKTRLCSGLKDTASKERAMQKVEEWYQDRLEWAISVGKPKLADRHRDLADCCKVFISLPEIVTVKDIKRKIDEIEALNYGPMLSSIHKAKGLEWDVVYWLGHDDHIKKMVQNKEIEDPASQEWNLRYVAITRAKQKLVLINEIDYASATEGDDA